MPRVHFATARCRQDHDIAAAIAFAVPQFAPEASDNLSAQQAESFVRTAYAIADAINIRGTAGRSSPGDGG